MTVNNLPSANTIRWTIRRKAEIVAAVHNGPFGLDEACESYRMSVEGVQNCEQLLDKRGFQDLRTTQLQDYRQPFLGTSNSKK